MQRYDVSVLGAGKFGSALAKRMRDGGLHVAVGSRRHDNQALLAEYGADVMPYDAACRASDVIILAVPWQVAEKTVMQLKHALDGKILVDATNPVLPDWSRLDVGQNGLSGAERIARVAENAKVIKAFNGLKAELLARTSDEDSERQVWICGDHEDAKTQVREIAERCGFHPQDCGQLDNALALEAIALLWIKLAYWEGYGEGLQFLMKNGGIPCES